MISLFSLLPPHPVCGRVKLLRLLEVFPGVITHAWVLSLSWSAIDTRGRARLNKSISQTFPFSDHRRTPTVAHHSVTVLTEEYSWWRSRKPRTNEAHSIWHLLHTGFINFCKPKPLPLPKEWNSSNPLVPTVYRCHSLRNIHVTLGSIYVELITVYVMGSSRKHHDFSIPVECWGWNFLLLPWLWAVLFSPLPILALTISTPKSMSITEEYWPINSVGSTVSVPNRPLWKIQ